VLHSFERHKYKQGTRYIAFRRSKEGSVKPSYIKQSTARYCKLRGYLATILVGAAYSYPDIAPRSYFCGLVSRREF
jgi:hypothetical protein